MGLPCLTRCLARLPFKATPFPCFFYAISIVGPPAETELPYVGSICKVDWAQNSTSRSTEGKHINDMGHIIN